MEAASRNPERILEVRNLRTYFHTREGVIKAVDGLSYHVDRGECLAIVGESACGKTVGAMSVLRLVPYPPGVIEGGEILFKGENLLEATEKRMREIRGNGIAIVFQEATTSLNPVLTVGRQIAESLTVHKGMSRKAALGETVRLLRRVGIPDPDKRVNCYPHELSGGMQQRVMIAMALSCNPEILIADEPTTALDVTVQAQILEIMEELRKESGTAVIIITHNLGVVARHADRVNVMYAGRMVESGPTQELYEHPMHPYTIGLLASVPRLDRKRQRNLRVIKGLPPNLARLPAGCSFAPRCDYAMPRCREAVPVLERAGEGHYRACFCDADRLTSGSGNRETR